MILSAELGWVCTPDWQESVTSLRAQAEQSAVLDSMVVAGDQGPSAGRPHRLREAFIGQLALARSVLRAVNGLHAVHSCESSYTLAGQINATAVSLSGAVTGGAGYLEVNLVAAQSRWKAAFAAENLALPARISALSADGEHTMLGTYESGLRCSWLNLYSAVTAAAAPLVTISELAECVAVADVVLG